MYVVSKYGCGYIWGDMSGGLGHGKEANWSVNSCCGSWVRARKDKKHAKTRFGEEGQGRPTEIDLYLWEIFFERESPPRKSAKRGIRNNQEKENSKNRQQTQTHLEKCNVASYY